MTKLYVSFRAASAASGSPRHEEAGTHRHVGRMPRVRRSAPRKRAHVSALPPSHRHDGRAGPDVSSHADLDRERRTLPPPPPLGASPTRPPARPSWTGGCGVLPGGPQPRRGNGRPNDKLQLTRKQPTQLRPASRLERTRASRLKPVGGRKIGFNPRRFRTPCGTPTVRLNSRPRAAQLPHRAGSHPKNERCGMVSHGAFVCNIRR